MLSPPNGIIDYKQRVKTYNSYLISNLISSLNDIARVNEMFWNNLKKCIIKR